MDLFICISGHSSRRSYAGYLYSSRIVRNHADSRMNETEDFTARKSTLAHWSD